MRSLDIFAGAGGLALGVEKAGFKNLGAIEFDTSCCATLSQNRPDWSVVHSDVRAYDFNTLEGKIDLLSGGPPCQPFSNGGKQTGRNDHRDMFPETVRTIAKIKPKAFLIENVKGLTRLTFTNYLEYIKLQLHYPELGRKRGEKWITHLARLEKKLVTNNREGLSYNVICRVLNSADYGIPQKRERIFFVGFRSDLSINWNFPQATHSKEALLREQATGKYWDNHLVLPVKQSATTKNLDWESTLLPWRTVRDAISDLPKPSRSKYSPEISGHFLQPGARSYPGHTGSSWDSPAKTLKAGVHGVPGGENMVRHRNGKVRYFTIRECARLQTFPDNYHFSGSWGSAMKQIGNSVPVDLAQLLASDIRKHIQQRTKRT